MSSAEDGWVWHSAGKPYSQKGNIHGIAERRKVGGFRKVCLLAAVLVSLVMVGMGFLHSAPMYIKTDKQGVVQFNCTIIQTCGCPGEPMIPWYLIVSGCLTIMLVFGRCISEKICLRCTRYKEDDMDKKCQLAYRACQFSCLALYNMLALTTTMLSLITGTKFVLGFHERKNYSTQQPNQDTCDWGLYWFTFILLIIGWVFIIFVILGLICRQVYLLLLPSSAPIPAKLG